MLEKLGWKVVAGVAALAAGRLTQLALTSAWRFVTGQPPPDEKPGLDAELGPTVAWAVATSAGLTVARLVARRGAARSWAAATGSYPPGERLPGESVAAAVPTTT